MAKFCTGCGAPLDGGARFCEQCGKPVAPTAAAAVAPKGPAHVEAGSVPKGAIGRKGLTVVGGIAVAALVAGGVAYLFLKAPGLPGAGEMTALLNADKALVQSLTCLDNFDYAADPVHVASWDSNTQSWLSVLVAGGVYAEPTRELSGGYFPQERLVYRHTDAGKKLVQGKKLCFAAGVAVDSVQFDVPAKDAQPPRATGRATYHFQQPAAWISSPAAREAMPDRFGSDTRELPVTLVLLDGKWQSMQNPAIRARAQQRARQDQADRPAPNEASGGGVFSWLEDLFGGNPGSAVQGRWVASDGLIPLPFEFRPKAAMIMGQEVPVTYRRTGETVEVLPSGEMAGAGAIKLVVVSNDELRMTDDGGQALRLKRAR